MVHVGCNISDADLQTCAGIMRLQRSSQWPIYKAMYHGAQAFRHACLWNPT